MSSRARAALATLSVLVAALLHLLLQAGMMLRWPGWNLSSFRNYFWSDQLAYLSIVRNVSQGEAWDVEPFTLTGTNYYPRGWYLLLGTVARWTNTDPATMWTLGGLAAQVLLVCAIGTACVLLTRRWWTGVLGFVPFLLGTGSWMLSGGESWMNLLSSHAVLWGPFGVLYTLNGETVALSFGGTALIALLLVAAGRVPQRAVWPVALVASLVVGLLANIQTYSFLTTSYTLVAATAAVGLVRTRSWRALALTGVLLVLVVTTGPLVADAVGQLAVLVYGMVPALPGVFLVLRATRWRALWCVGLVALGALPQVAATALGLAGEDPFLVYREASSTQLGVPLGGGVFAALAVIPAIVLVIVAGVRRRRVLWVAVPSALAVLWVYLAANDKWGANQEPYRFWLDLYVIIGTLVVPLLAWVVAEALGSRAAEPGLADRPAEPEQTAPVLGPWSRPGRLAVIGGLALVVVVAGVWSYDFRLFRSSVSAAGYIPLDGPGYQAQVDLADETDGGLVLPDACVDPMIFKSTWGGPVGYYNKGLAWPDNKDDLDIAINARAPGNLDQAAAMRAGIRWLLVDTSCETDLTEGLDAHRVAARDVEGAGSWELWKLDE